MSIIKSMLDQDFYKLSMMQAVFHQFPKVEVKYKFVCRNDRITVENFPIKKIKKEISALTRLRFTKEEINYLRSLNLFKEDFLDYLKTFKLSFSAITINEGIWGGIRLTISGLWLETILFEVPVLAIINELYFRKYDNDRILSSKIGIEKLFKDITLIQKNNKANNEIQFMEFGTRRRHSHKWQMFIINQLKTHIPENLIGTSNVYFAKKFGLKPMGTMAHEWIQAGLALAPITREAQTYMLHKWIKEYPDKLKVALTDTFGFDAFLKDFDNTLSGHYDGLRQDSGDPKEWLCKLHDFYKSKIDICEYSKRTLIFSDNLNFEKCYDVLNHMYAPEYNIIFGIGTYLTNNLLRSPLNIVIKMVECDFQPVCKLSDSSGKEICENKDYLEYVREVFK